jgi:hypothetical protein
VAEGTRVISFRPGVHADATRAWAAAHAEQVTQQVQPDLASRAAELAARVADLVSAQYRGGPEPAPSKAPAHTAMEPVSGVPDAPRFEVPTTSLSERTTVRRAMARFTGNSAGSRAGTRRADRDFGVGTRGNRNA